MKSPGQDPTLLWEVKSEAVVEKGFAKLGHGCQSRRLTPWEEAFPCSTMELGLAITKWPGHEQPRVKLCHGQTDDPMLQKKIGQGAVVILPWTGYHSSSCFNGHCTRSPESPA